MNLATCKNRDSFLTQVRCSKCRHHFCNPTQESPSGCLSHCTRVHLAPSADVDETCKVVRGGFWRATVWGAFRCQTRLKILAMRIEILYNNLCGLAVRADRKSDTGSADSVLTEGLIGERLAVVVFQRKGEFLRTFPIATPSSFSTMAMSPKKSLA